MVQLFHFLLRIFFILLYKNSYLFIKFSIVSSIFLYLNSKPASNNLFGIALCPSVNTFEPSLKIKSKTKVGTGKTVGLCKLKCTFFYNFIKF